MIQPTLIDTAPQNRHAAKLVMATAIQDYGVHGAPDQTVMSGVLRDVLEALAVDHSKDSHAEYGIEVHEHGTSGPRIVVLPTPDLEQAQENFRTMRDGSDDVWRDPKLVVSTVVRSTWAPAETKEV